MVSAFICMQMTPKSMGSVVRLQRLSFRISSIPLHRWCRQVDALQPAPAECCIDRGSLVYIQSTPPSATSVTHPSGDRPSHASFRCPQPRHPHGRWCVNEVAHLKDSSCLFCDSASTAEYPSRSFALRSTVTSFVPRSAAVWLWQRNAGCHSIPSRQADAVDDEFCCWACVFCIEVRRHHATPSTVALAEGAGVHQV